MKKGKLFILVGPTAVGKNTLISLAAQQVDDFVRMPSATTRQPREGEIPGVSKVFLTEEEFDENIRNNQFVEWQVIHGHRYGVLKNIVQARIDEGKDYVVDVEVLGAVALKKLYGKNAILIFVLPPSLEALEERIKSRNAESDDEIYLRLARSKAEINFLPFCDYVVLNDDLQTAVNELSELVLFERGVLNDYVSRELSINAEVCFLDNDNKLLVDESGAADILSLPIKDKSLAVRQVEEFFKINAINAVLLNDKSFDYEQNKGMEMAQPMWVDFDFSMNYIGIRYLFLAKLSGNSLNRKSITLDELSAKNEEGKFLADLIGKYN
jgi:guanylate kinase